MLIIKPIHVEARVPVAINVAVVVINETDKEDDKPPVTDTTAFPGTAVEDVVIELVLCVTTIEPEASPLPALPICTQESTLRSARA